jgi:hypothetical protein
MPQTIARVYEADADARSAVSELKKSGFAPQRISLVTPAAEGANDDVAAAIESAGVTKTAAAMYAERVRKGGAVVSVRPQFGEARRAATILDSFHPTDGGVFDAPANDVGPQSVGGPTKEGAPPDAPAAALCAATVPRDISDDAAPFSRLLGLPVLLDSPAPLSTKLGWRVLADDPAPLSRKLGWSVLSSDPAPLSRRLGLRVLTDGAPTSEKLGVPTLTSEPQSSSTKNEVAALSDDPAPLSGKMHVPTLSDDPAPLSHALGLPVLTGDATTEAGAERDPKPPAREP